MSGDTKIVWIAEAVTAFRNLPRILHIGGKRRNHYDFALETRPDVVPIEILKYKVYRGKDTSLDTSLWDSLQ